MKNPAIFICSKRAGKLLEKLLEIIGFRQSDVTEKVQISSGRASVPRASAIADSHLDIPAFIRKQSE